MMDLSVYIGLEGLSGYAASAARLLERQEPGPGKLAAQRLSRSFSQLRRCHRLVERRYGALASPPSACQWLLDNWHLAQRCCLACMEDLRRAPELDLYKGEPLLGCLCRSLVASGKGRVDLERCRAYLVGFQSVLPLRRRELELFPAALTAALLEAMAQVCRDLCSSADTLEHAQLLSALFGSLDRLQRADLEELLESVDLTGAILSGDPTGEYPRMDSATKAQYLHRAEELARREGISEQELAQRLLDKAKAQGKHVGFYLFPQRPRRGEGLYIALQLLLPLSLSLLLAFALGSPPAALLLLIPIWQLVKDAIDQLLLHLISPRPLPRMDMSRGIPPEGRTLCVISTILGPDQARDLERLRLASRAEGKELLFGLLADLPSAPTAQTEGDSALLRSARRQIRRLDIDHGGGFYLFTRPRSFDGRGYSGQERKRGALLELAKLLSGRDSALEVYGDRAGLQGVKYIITLDSDTRIWPGSLGELVGAALHPLNKPQIDPRLRRVVRGHGLLHPRIATELQSAVATDFALIFAGSGGSDPYGGLASELYMDAFACGGFGGKGLIDIEALLSCAGDSLPKGRILSHDALEGAYLRGGYMGDVEFSDSFPHRPLAYYKRLHRWIRGDWQNAPWIFHRELRAMDRFRLLDSIRRSLLAPMTFISIVWGLAAPWSALGLAAWAALLALLSDILRAIAEASLQKRQKVRLRRHTRLLTGVGGAMVRSFMGLWLLPYEAWVCMSAIGSALWRMLVSRRDLLQWQTSAQAQGEAEDLAAHIRRMWLPVLLGLLLMAFSPLVLGKAGGFLWLLSPAAAWAISLPAYREHSLSPRDRAYLLDRCRETLSYLTAYTGEQDNYLPPDNVQHQPPVGPAHRTSPTNIGLALAAVECAARLGLMTQEQAADYISRCADSLERMPRCLGHFYNWYDTTDLSPMKPLYISTVDSGNLYAGLLCARQALLSQGRLELAQRLEKLMKPMDFSPLFDKSRGLFHICYDAEKSRGAGGWYDLMASEAMLTSYLAVAKGDVPVSHWRRLSRAQLQKDGYRGMASWSGTMFEYLMPALFLPIYRGSALSESCRFCLYAQKRRRAPNGAWGISESAFYSLDSALNYRYKAHGCPALALKRGQEEDLVLSPYSSFLALAVEPEAAVRSLRRLEQLGGLGPWGFWEALDLTPGRGRGEVQVVSCCMAHHVSMSLIAAANALCQGYAQKLFMSQPSMAAFDLLLQEQLPARPVVIRRQQARPEPEPQRPIDRRWQLRGGPEDEPRPCCVLSNGAYHMLCTASGRAQASLGDSCIYRALPHEGGPELWANGKRVFPALRPSLWELGEEQARCTMALEGLTISQSLGPAWGRPGELRQYELCCREKCEFDLELRFQPILAPLPAYEAHPAYWRLGIRAEREGRALLLHRLPKGEQQELWLCLLSDRRLCFSADAGGGLGDLARPLVRAWLRLSLEPGRSQGLLIALCLGRSRREALDGAGQILAQSCRSASMTGAAAARLGLSPQQIGAAMELVEPLWQPRLKGACPKKDLWPYGISGDLPIVALEGDSPEAPALLRRFCLLKSCGLEADLVFLTGQQGQYPQPLMDRLRSILSPLGLEPLIGSAGGVHLAPMEAAEEILSRAISLSGERPVLLPRPRLSRERDGSYRPSFQAKGDSFSFRLEGKLPPRAWQNIITNGRLSYIAADCGLGNMWLENCRELAVSPPAEPEATAGPELLYVRHRGRWVSLFAAGDGCPCTVTYAPGWARWDKELDGRKLSLTALVCRDRDARLLLIQGAAGMKLGWSLELLLGPEDGAAVRCGAGGSSAWAESRESYLEGRRFNVLWSCRGSFRHDYAPAALALRALGGGEDMSILACGFCTLEELRALTDPAQAIMELAAVKGMWKSFLGRLSLESGLAPMDRYLSLWGPYQAYACRMLARGSLYQRGGAIGFRDQLQDSIGLLLHDPSLARDQILLCCRHQYLEGDVMHWWHPHPQGDRGVRTRCSDDLLWLCWALAEYVKATGDLDLCLEKAELIASPTLSDRERDRYETPSPSGKEIYVIDHAILALERCIGRGFGPHGLPLIGSGDWNDALDRVEGESAWLGWFFSHCARELGLLLERLGRGEGKRYLSGARQVGQAADAAWGGSWYIRGYFPEGQALGGPERMDLTVQAWAALSPYADPQRSALALDQALDRLVDGPRRLVKLLDPPYSSLERSPGYIVGYGEGYRENGGQYTHAAIWLALACLRRDRAGEGFKLLQYLLPELRDLGRYQGEPFVLPADIASAKGREGLAGWTWYTGSAGWYLQAVERGLLGLELREGLLYISPLEGCPLKSWDLSWTSPKGRSYHIRCDRGHVYVDGQPYLGQGLG